MRHIAFLVLPEFSNLGLAAATEPLFVANWLSQRTLFNWRLLSVDGAAVRASNGRLYEVDGNLDGPLPQSVFVLASFDAARAVRERRAVSWLKRIGQFGVEVAGIENGSWILAKAGLLNGHPVAVHWDNAVGFQTQFPHAHVVPQLFVRSRDRLTCAGATATLDMMVAWIGWYADTALAGEVALHLLMGAPRHADTQQRGDAMALTGDGIVAQVRALMSAHIEEPLTCDDIAHRTGLSLRQIERRFKEEMQCSLLHHYRQVRMAKAHQLLQQTAWSVTDVALACGFSSPEYFCRLYRRLFGCSPSRDRRQSTTAPVLRQQGTRHV